MRTATAHDAEEEDEENEKNARACDTLVTN